MSRIPDKTALLRFLQESPTPLTKRDIMDAFGIRGETDRQMMKSLLRDLEEEGAIEKQPGQAYAIGSSLPAVAVVEVAEIDLDGDVFAKPTEWDESLKGPAPRIEITADDKKGHLTLKEGDRALVRLRRFTDQKYEGHVIKRLDDTSGQVMGLVIQQKKGMILSPTDKRAKFDFDIPDPDLNGAKDGDLAIGEIQPSRGLHRKKVRITQIIGRRDDPRAFSLIAMHEAGLKEKFPDAVLNETKDMRVPDLKGREDLRDYPLVTIDGLDARDFDDAVFAQKVDGGYHLIVAIADVAFYVRPNTALDKEAYRRGNSTYFPDRVVPMLPEALSNDLCSLRPHENRACMAFHLWIDAHGALLKYKISRGLMRSVARLTYEQVQTARDGNPDETTKPLIEPVITLLYAVYDILNAARSIRGALDLDLPERQILIDKAGNMTGVKNRARYDSHKLIEEFMILANVAAARALEDKKAPCVYRVHDRPSLQKLDAVREFVDAFGLSLPKGQVVKPAQINHLLTKAKELPYSHLISQVLLRAQAQAIYDPENIGHFGLALEKYAHFTSPIRRYADLLVHRSLIRAYNLGDGGLSDEEIVTLEEKSQHISETERNSASAERSSIDRFTAQWMSERVGEQFSGRITSVTRFGLFVSLDENGADGLVPMRALPDDYYVHDESQHALIGRKSGRIYRLGAPLTIKITEAEGYTGSSVFAVVGKDSADLPGIKFKTANKGLQKSSKPSNRHKNLKTDGRNKPDKRTKRKSKRR
jgi:ribonuclease R